MSRAKSAKVITEEHLAGNELVFVNKDGKIEYIRLLEDSTWRN
jgi:hypothetical protein